MSTDVAPKVPPLGADSTNDVLALYRAHLSKGRATIAELFGSHMEVASDGAWLWSADGQRFLNCGGYGVFLLGARHPAVVEAVRAQLDRHPVATRILLEPTVAHAAEALAAVTPSGMDRIHFALGGAEAVETGLKLARAHGKRRVISMHHGYHGKSLGALSATAKEVYQRPFRPLLPDVTHVPFGDAAALERELVNDRRPACVILEPVQGEGGVVIPPPGYLRQVEALCRAHDGFLILDEIQTGMGRLGAWWGADLESVSPHVLLAGKALGGGVVPVSAAIASAEVFAPFDKDPFIHTATFSGQPLLMAAVQATVQTMTREQVVPRARELGARLLPELQRIVWENCPDLVCDVRGQGLLIGIEMREPGLAGELLAELFHCGLVANHSMTGSEVVRFTPPAMLTDHQVQFLLDAVDRATRLLVRRQARMPQTKR